jgi:hypothetical protein
MLAMLTLASPDPSSPADFAPSASETSNLVLFTFPASAAPINDSVIPSLFLVIASFAASLNAAMPLTFFFFEAEALLDLLLDPRFLLVRFIRPPFPDHVSSVTRPSNEVERAMQLCIGRSCSHIALPLANALRATAVQSHMRAPIPVPSQCLALRDPKHYLSLLTDDIPLQQNK